MALWNHRNGMQILVVEDSTTQAEQLAAILENHGYKAVIAGDGEQALEMIKEWRPGLVISDVVMPKLDGYGLSCAIKTNPATKDIPVILVTTLSDPNDVLRGLECGADNFIRKPIEERYLLSRIDYLLMNRELRADQITQIGLEIDLRGQRYFINSDRQQILDLLISTYEQAVDLNKELSLHQQELARSHEVLDSLYRIADDLNKAVTKREVFEKVIDRVMELPDVYAAWISFADAGSGLPKVVAAHNLPFAIGDQQPVMDCQCLTELKKENCPPAFNVYDCICMSELDDTMPGMRCHASVPLALSTGNRIGVMNLVSPDEYGFDDAQLQLLAGIGNQIVVALERAEMHENLENLVAERTAQVHRLNRLYSVLSGINTTIVRTRTTSELFDEVCRIAIDEGAFAFVWIGTVNKGELDVAQVTCASSTGVEPAPEEVSKAIAKIQRSGLLEQAFQSGEPIIQNNIGADQSATDNLTRNYKSTAVLPLLRGGVLAGVCVLYAAEADAFNDEEEMNLLEEIAGDIGFALDYQEKDRRLNYLAYFDGITGLPNRSLFADRLNQSIHKADRQDRWVGVATLGLDRFKTINDSLGHAVGDALLRAIAKRLRSAVNEGDTVARMSGDEFGFIFTDMDQEEDPSHIVTRMLSCFNKPFLVADHELFISASLGVTICPTDGDGVDELIQNADAAMYRVKAEGGSGYQFYAANMTLKARERLALENDLRRALERREFLLHYQPIVDAISGKITGVETLVRWLSPERGLVSPVDFIPVAEETLLIIELGAWVMEEACRQITSGWGTIAPELRLAVNVSTRQFLQGNFLAMVTAAIKRSAINPECLTLEITESHLMENVDEMIAIMHQLGELGIRFSIDDFGTGYSSLAYLKNLPIANLKIDRSFVQGLPANANDVAIVKTIISMAHSLNQRVIAEGVETKEQLEFLRANGCDAIQGYYFSKPLPADDLASLLMRGGQIE